MRIGLLALLLAMLPAVAVAQGSPVGRWKTLDDETGKPMTIVEVYEARGGTLAARIVGNIAAPPTCGECRGTDRNKSIIGMPVLWGLKHRNVSGRRQGPQTFDRRQVHGEVDPARRWRQGVPDQRLQGDLLPRGPMAARGLSRRRVTGQGPVRRTSSFLRVR